MGFLSDIFFGTDTAGSVPKKKPNNGGWENERIRIKGFSHELRLAYDKN